MSGRVERREGGVGVGGEWRSGGGCTMYHGALGLLSHSTSSI